MQVTWLSYDKQNPAYCKIIWEFGGTDQGEKMQQRFKGNIPRLLAKGIRYFEQLH